MIWTCGLLAAAFLYLFDPQTTAGFLPCPFRYITGWLCPGCGAQRAMHDLMHGRFLEAFHHNAALVTALPLLGLQWSVPRILRSPRRFDQNNAIVLMWLIGILAWGVLRNLQWAHAH